LNLNGAILLLTGAKVNSFSLCDLLGDVKIKVSKDRIVLKAFFEQKKTEEIILFTDQIDCVAPIQAYQNDFRLIRLPLRII
jgi:hypothetical protein